MEHLFQALHTQVNCRKVSENLCEILKFYTREALILYSYNHHRYVLIIKYKNPSDTSEGRPTPLYCLVALSWI